ncbi:hypothetical protein V6M85_04440 [Sulfolobus tengchongensis]|uniref:Uncharacterized protein n=1 Tax=Sulfolobus tengchongensis TaxID=207809 RepID=A0AAX4L3U6_9CREN
MLPLIVLATATNTTTKAISTTIPPLVQTIEIFSYISIGLGALGVAIGVIIWLTSRRAK